LQVAGAGGSGVGQFETSLSMPPQIQVTRSLEPGTIIGRTMPFRVTWTGGNSDSIVRMRVIANLPRYESIGYECTALASDGHATLDVYGQPALLPLPPRDDVEVVLIVLPRKTETFSAPGLTRDGRHEWTYEYHFQGLKIR
jgi:hypothetical protein